MNSDMVITKDEAEKSQQMVSVGVQGEYVMLLVGNLRVSLTRESASRLAEALLRAEAASRDMHKMQDIVVPG